MPVMNSTDEQLYSLMREIGDKRVKETVQNMRESGMMSKTGPGSALLASAGQALVKTVKSFVLAPDRKNKSVASMRLQELIASLGVEKCIALSLRCVFDQLAKEPSGVSFGALRLRVGKALEEEADFQRFSVGEKTSKLYKHIQNRIAKTNRRGRDKYRKRLRDEEGIPDAGWDRLDVNLIGSFMLDTLVKHAGLFEMIQERDRKNPKKFNNLVRLQKDVLDWLLEGTYHLAEVSPSKLPITSPPVDWDEKGIGGYHPEGMPKFHLMSSHNKAQYRKFLENPCKELFQGVNTLQRTPWKINKFVLDVARTVIDAGWHELDFDIVLPVEPKRPTHEYDPECPIWRTYQREKRQYKAAMDRYHGVKLSVARVISTAEIYSSFAKFYFPHIIDFRGRSYCVSGGLNYQGDDLNRAILTFSDPKPITTECQRDWFYVHGANCWGKDKVPIYERIRWVEQNKENIQMVAADPFGFKWWLEADKPFQFLAWCKEASEFFDEGYGYMSCLPVAMDGSNNGLQIYSLILRDAVGGYATNCVPDPYPQDAYQQVADAVTRRLKKIQKEGEEDDARKASRLLTFCYSLGYPGIPREVTKRPVMTQPYGATKYATQRYTVEWYHDYVRGKRLTPEEEPFPERDAYNIFVWLGDIIWDAIGEVVQAARGAMEWMRKVSDIAAEHNEHITWTTPLGAVITQAYRKTRAKKIWLKAGGRLVINHAEEIDEVNSSKSRNGFCPNFIHSLDASAMYRTVNEAAKAGITHFQMVHDSYGTHAADAPELAKILRQVFVDLFSDNLFVRLKEEIETQLPEGVTLPDPPAEGTLDINRLTESEYFFA